MLLKIQLKYVSNNKSITMVDENKVINNPHCYDHNVSLLQWSEGGGGGGGESTYLFFM